MSLSAGKTKSSWLQPSKPITADAFVRGAGLNLLLVIASGILCSFMFPPREVWWFSWLFLVPLLVALRRTEEIRASVWLALLFGIVFFFSTLAWLRTIFGVSAVGIFTLASLPLLLFGLAYRMLIGRVDRWSSRWWAALAVVVMTPMLWVAVEWIRTEGWYFQFSWAQFGFTMASCRRGGVLYPFIGVYGVTFLIVLVNAIVAEILTAKARWAGKLLGIALCAAVMVPFSLYLNKPVGIPNEQGERSDTAIRVAIVQHEVGNLRELRERTLAIARWKPDLIVWPEYAIIDYPLADKKLLASLQDIARQTHSTLVLGCKDHVANNARVDWLRRRAMMSIDGALFGNTALIIGPDGAILGKYYKTHPIQFFSDGVPGRAYPTFPTPAGRLGVAICYDLDFASCPRRLVQNGAEILVTPTFDAKEWTDLQHTQHARMAQARAAENGRWLVRATSSGVSQVVNPSGFITASIQSGPTEAAIGIAVPRHETTPYVRYMYRLPFVCLGVSLLWMLWILGSSIIRRMSRKNPENLS